MLKTLDLESALCVFNESKKGTYMGNTDDIYNFDNN